jgi:hypothetical protein
MHWYRDLRGEIAVDPLDGIHVIHEGPSADGQLYYGYCPSGCRTSKFKFTAVPGAMGIPLAGTGALGLAVDGEGRPRLLTAEGNGTATYFECNGSCTDAANWTSATILVPDPPTGDRIFAVTPDGSGAAFVFGGQGGLVYDACTSNCTNAANWTQTAIPAPAGPSYVRGASYFRDTALRIDAQGRPRVIYWADLAQPGYALSYAACDQGCASASGWTSLMLSNQKGAYGVAPKLALDAQGRPRAWFQGTTSDGTTPLYAWCDADDCTLSTQDWQAVTAPNADDMALDGQGNPHLVSYGTSGNQSGVLHAYCSSGCDSLPVWDGGILPDTDMDAAAPDTSGTDGIWSIYKAISPITSPRLAVDAQGNAGVILDAARYPDLDGSSPDLDGGPIARQRARVPAGTAHRFGSIT